MDINNINFYMRRTKRERSNNFSAQETDLLISLVEKYKDIVENKKSDANIWQEKERAWTQIEKAFNSATHSIFRSRKHLKLKYEGLKRYTRMKSKTGEGTKVPVLTPAEEKVRNIILLSGVGNANCHDSDPLTSSTTIDASAGKHWLSTADSNILLNDETITDESCNVTIKIEPTEANEELKEELSSDSESEQILESDSVPTQNVQMQRERRQWHPKTLRSKRHPGFCKSKRNMPLDLLTKEKIQLTRLQQMVLKRELEQKVIQTKLLEEELEHKKIIHHLEKQQLILKIELLKSEISKNK